MKIPTFALRIPEAVKTQIERLNGRRKVRTVGLASLENIVAAVCDDAGQYSVRIRHGGTVANSYGYDAVATVAIAVRIGSRVYAGATLTNAKRGCTGVGRLDLLDPEGMTTEEARYNAYWRVVALAESLTPVLQ